MTISAQARAAFQSVQALRLGHCYIRQIGDRVEISVDMRDASLTTPTRLNYVAGSAEEHDLRVVERRIVDATLLVECVPSECRIGAVSRIARTLDGKGTLIMLRDYPSAGVMTVPDEVVEDVRTALLTKIEDEVVIWKDLDAGGAPGPVTSFRNRTLKALP